jgi:hypothetical protein
MNKKYIIAIISAVLVLGIFIGCRTLRSNDSDIRPLMAANEQELTGRRLEITFSYDRVRMIGSSQYAFWIEDMDGNYVDTLYVTQWTARGGYSRRPTSISQWVSAAGLAKMQQSEIDTISGATPRPGDYLVTWDFTDRNGNLVTGAQYRYFIEATMNFNDHALFSGIITIGEALAYNPAPAFSPPDTRFHNMITNVRVVYYPN